MKGKWGNDGVIMLCNDDHRSSEQSDGWGADADLFLSFVRQDSDSKLPCLPFFCFSLCQSAIMLKHLIFKMAGLLKLTPSYSFLPNRKSNMVMMMMMMMR